MTLIGRDPHRQHSQQADGDNFDITLKPEDFKVDLETNLSYINIVGELCVNDIVISPNVNADWDSVSGDSEILNKPSDVTDLSIHASSELSDGADLVKGPASATDNAIARFDGVTGKLVQNSPATIDDDGNVSGLKDTSTETVTIDSAVQMSYDADTETLKFTFL